MHVVKLKTYSSRIGIKTIQKEADKDCERNGDYEQKASPIRMYNHVMSNYEEALKFIEENDKGWYDSLAVQYKDGRAKKWLVKYEYHC